MRAFIAIDIKNEELLTNFRKLQSIFSSLKPDIKLISPNNLHLTLSFLGEITLDESKKISSKLNDIKFNKINVVYNDLGVFPSRNNIHVIWIGFTPDSESHLKNLSKVIDEKLSCIEIYENKPFHPHITIARIKNNKNIDKLLNSIDSMKNQYFGSEIFDNITLKSSTLTPDGPIYRDLFTKSLSGDILNE